jgi:hypothetical protein
MDSFARSFYLLMAASVPAAFGLLLTAIEMLQALNDITTLSINDPTEIAARKAAALAPAGYGFEISAPLWIAWAIYLLVISLKRKQ